MDSLQDAIIKGMRDRARELTLSLLEHTPTLTVVNEQIIPALDTVGKGFEEKTVYLPTLLMAAEAAKAAFEPISAALAANAEQRQRLTVVIATVKGDIHDIGKNIVSLLLENYGFAVIDLGRDVPPEAILAAVREHQAPIVGLSALMTTTVPAMEETVRLLRREAPWCRIVVGGAVLTEDYAAGMGADHYAPDAMDTVRYAERVEAEMES